MDDAPAPGAQRDRIHHQVMVKAPWFKDLADGARHFEVVDDRGFAIGDVVHLWESESVPSTEGPHDIATGKRLVRQVNYVLDAGPAYPGLTFGFVVIGLGTVKSSGSGGAGSMDAPQVILLRQPHRERLAA
jgi:uncharacterized protein DUF3850